MKRFLHTSLFVLFSFYAIFSQATANTIYSEGKDYEVISNNSNIPLFPKNKITVTEFFSYGCPWCYQMEPQLQQWLKKKPANVEFTRAPVIFERHWDIYAKAYYIARALGIERQMTPKLFNAIQEKNKTLATDEAMEQFFVKAGVKEETAKNAFEASPTLDAEIRQGPQLMQVYQIYVVPAIVIDGKYKTDLRLALDEKKMIDIVNFLIKKRELEKNLR